MRELRGTGRADLGTRGPVSVHRAFWGFAGHRRARPARRVHSGQPAQVAIFLCLPRAERNQRVLFVKNEYIKFCCSGGFSNVPDVMEASVLFISTGFHVRSVSCRCLYLGFRASCAARVTCVMCSKRSLLGVPLELE